MIRGMHKKLLPEQEEGQQLSAASVEALHGAAELLIGLVIADSIAISEDTTKSKSATLKLQKPSMYLAQAVRHGAGAGTLRTLLAAFHQRSGQCTGSFTFCYKELQPFSVQSPLVPC